MWIFQNNSGYTLSNKLPVCPPISQMGHPKEICQQIWFLEVPVTRMFTRRHIPLVANLIILGSLYVDYHVDIQNYKREDCLIRTVASDLVVVMTISNHLAITIRNT